MIPKDTVDAILQATIIEEVVGEFVQLKKSGTSMRGMSPFSNEKTPSFYVVPGQGHLQGFQLGQGRQRRDLPDGAREALLSGGAALAGQVSMGSRSRSDKLTPEELEEQTGAGEPLQPVGLGPKVVFVAQLLETGEGKSVGLGYLRSRGFTDGTIEGYRPGLVSRGAVGSEEGALAAAARKAGYKEKWLVDQRAVQGSGTTVKLYDFYRGPGDVSQFGMSPGRFIGFGGRTLKIGQEGPEVRQQPGEPAVRQVPGAVRDSHGAERHRAGGPRRSWSKGYTDVMAMRQAGGGACGGELRHRADCVDQVQTAAAVQQAHDHAV